MTKVTSVRAKCIMKKDCILLATLPSLNNMDKVKKVFFEPCISEVRFNTGGQFPYTQDEIISYLNDLARTSGKKLWVDVKGRQLKVTKWADPLYSCIEINHKVKVDYPAKVVLRGGDIVDLTTVQDGNKLFVDPLPKQAVGAGQSVNIFAKNLEIEGYLTEKDKIYLQVCKKIGITNIMASFVESFKDLKEITDIIPNAQIVSKVESLKGVDFIANNDIKNLMAARDDLYLQSGQNYDILRILKLIIERDPQAICASRIFLSLEKNEKVNLADYTDLELMYQMGYRKFMLCDNICNYNFDKAIKAWKEFIGE